MQKIRQCIRYLFSRSFVFYLILIGLCLALIDRDKEREGLKVRTLNALAPVSYDALLDPEPGSLDPYIAYYQKIIEYLPGMADAYGQLGYCHYYNGRPDLALENYKKAVSLNAHFFWFHYNLGVIYYQQGDLESAVPAITRALQTRPELSFLFMKDSRLYRQIFRLQSVEEPSITKNMKQGLLRCHQLMILMHSKGNNMPLVFKIAEHALSQFDEEQDFFYFYAGLANYYLKNYKQAVYYFQECVKRNAKSVEAFELLALSLKVLGDEATATKALKQALFLKKTGEDIDYGEIQFSPRVF